jgi:hypothetical protein
MIFDSSLHATVYFKNLGKLAYYSTGKKQKGSACTVINEKIRESFLNTLHRQYTEYSCDALLQTIIREAGDEWEEEDSQQGALYHLFQQQEARSAFHLLHRIKQ